MQTDLIEPEVWIEFLRLDSVGGVISGINMIIPKGTTVKSHIETETGDVIWEWLV